MSWGTCYKGSNNIHADFPALMSDGQWATNWEPACAINSELKKSVGITNNYNYRQYLINNADHIIQQNQNSANGNCGASHANFNMEDVIKQPVKHIFKSSVDTSQPFGYQNSDLKNMYLSSKALDSRLVAPIMTQAQMLSMPNFN